MKKLLLVTAAIIAMASTTAFAGTPSIEVGASYLSEPDSSGMGSGTGYKIALGSDLESLNAIPGSMFQSRFEFGYNKWSATQSGQDIKYERIPFEFGLRLNVPVGATGLRAFGGLGVEVSRDSVTTPITLYGSSATTTITSTNTHYGFTPSVGLEYSITPSIFVGADVKYHTVVDPYMTSSAVIGYKFH